jgi:hypothetical protein
VHGGKVEGDKSGNGISVIGFVGIIVGYISPGTSRNGTSTVRYEKRLDDPGERRVHFRK